MAPQELYAQLPHEKTALHFPYAYGELAQDVTMTYFSGRWDKSLPVMRRVAVPAGTTVKIVMVSRLGDFGITENLGALHGHSLRTRLDDGLLMNLRRHP